MSKIFFGKLKSFEDALRSKGWNELIFLDYNNKHDLVKQLKDKLDFICENSNHWVEIKLEDNGYMYWLHVNKTVIIHEDWILEKRFF